MRTSTTVSKQPFFIQHTHKCKNLPLRLSGVTVLAVGIGQADTEELRRAVTDDNTQTFLYARDAAQLDSLHTNLADLLCGIARIPEVIGKW